MNITEFLLARIGEDEAAAGKLAGVAHSAKTQVYTGEEWVTTPISTERVLAECAAKRAIVDLHDALEDKGWQSGKDHGYLWCGSCGTLDDAPVPYPCETLEALAAVYKDHPDYQEEWAL